MSSGILKTLWDYNPITMKHMLDPCFVATELLLDNLADTDYRAIVNILFFSDVLFVSTYKFTIQLLSYQLF